MSFARYLASLFVALVATYVAGVIAAPHVYSLGFWPLWDAGIAAVAIGGLTLAMANTPILSFVLSFVGGTLCAAFLYDVTPDHYKFWVANASSHIPLLFAGCFWFISAVMVVLLIQVLRARARGNTQVVEAHRVSSDAVRTESGKATFMILGLLAIGIASAAIGKELFDHHMIGLNTLGYFVVISFSTWFAACGLLIVQLMRRPRNGTT